MSPSKPWAIKSARSKRGLRTLNAAVTEESRQQKKMVRKGQVRQHGDGLGEGSQDGSDLPSAEGRRDFYFTQRRTEREVNGKETKEVTTEFHATAGGSDGQHFRRHRTLTLQNKQTTASTNNHQMTPVFCPNNFARRYRSIKTQQLIQAAAHQDKRKAAEQAQTITVSDNAKSSYQHNFRQVTDKDQDLGAFEEPYEFGFNEFLSERSHDQSKSLDLISLDKETEQEYEQSDKDKDDKEAQAKK